MLEKIMQLDVLLYSMAAIGVMGAIGMLATHLTYRRIIRNTDRTINLKEKWLNLWKTRDRLLSRMDRLVWYPSLICTLFLGLAFVFATRLRLEEGLPLVYLYLGTAVPVALLLLRRGLDFSYREALLMNSLADYIEKARTWIEEAPQPRKQDPALQEEMVEQITASIRQTAATGSHFSKMLSREEEEIMREVIREFMQPL